jgi:hypothetical protein
MKAKKEASTAIRITDTAHAAAKLYVVMNGKKTICDFVSELIIKKTKYKNGK